MFCRSCNQKTSETESETRKREPKAGKVAVAAESTPLEDPKTEKKDRACGYYIMEVIGKVDSDHVNKFIKKNAAEDIVLFTDKNTAFVDIADIVDTHYMVVSDKVSVNQTLKWVHDGISNLKRNLLGIHQMITYKYFTELPQ